MPGKRIELDNETLHALKLLSQDTMKTFQELADEAFRDLLKKHGRPETLRQALRASVEQNDKSVTKEKPGAKSGVVVPLRGRRHK